MNRSQGASGSEGGLGNPDPTVHQLRLLLVLAEERHFGRAATRLFVSQPALSKQLRHLEQRLGFELFKRNSRKVEITEACRSLLPEAEAVVRSMDRLRQVAEAQDREASGRLVVGTIGAEASMPHARATLDELRARHPEIAVEVQNLNFVDHMARLINKEVDVVFLRPPVPPGIQQLHMATETRVVCLPTHDPLASRLSLSLSDLAGRPVVDVPPGTPRVWWKFWVSDPRPDDSPVRYGPVAADLEALLHSVATGAAVAFLPSAARTFFPRPGVAYVDLEGVAPCTSALAWSAADRERPAIVAIRQAADAVLAARPGSTS